MSPALFPGEVVYHLPNPTVIFSVECFTHIVFCIRYGDSGYYFLFKHPEEIKNVDITDETGVIREETEDSSMYIQWSQTLCKFSCTNRGLGCCSLYITFTNESYRNFKQCLEEWENYVSPE